MTASIKLGIAVSLSGCYAPLGRQVLAGLECYVEYANDQGGISLAALAPRQLVLEVRDDESDPNACARSIVELIDDAKCDLLLGPYGSGTSLAAATVATDRRFVLWNHSGASDEIHAGDNAWVVSMIGSASTYLHGALSLLEWRNNGRARIALISANTGFANVVADGALEMMANGPFDLVRHLRYESGVEDLADLIAPLHEMSIDCVLGVGRYEDDVALARSLLTSELNPKAIAVVAAGVDAFRADLGIASNGFTGPSQWEPNANYAVDCGPSASTFVDLFRSIHDYHPDYPAAQGFIGGVIALECVRRAESLDQTALRQAASQLRCQTFYGPFEIDPSSGQQVAHKVLTTQWQNGRRRVVWPADVAQTPFDYPI